MGISLCVITRDEERLLPRLLKSVQGVVDEIIVVDNGSTDRTAEVARRAGARVLLHAGADDFSAARNVSLAAAREPWILVLDADEQLAPGAGDLIRRAVRRTDRCGYYLPFINDLGNGRQHVCGMVRLFRNDPRIRFRYVIHEQVLPDLVEYARASGQAIVPLPGAVVLHDGYLPERARERGKDARNERLFRLQVERHPESAYSWYKFGDFLRRFAERKSEAVAALERAAELVRALPPEEAALLSFPAEVFALLGLERDKQGDAAGAQRYVDEGARRFGETPNLLFVRAHLEAKAGRHRDAFKSYARLRRFDGALLPIPPEPGITGPYAFFGMGRALANFGRRRAAMRCLVHSLARDPDKSDPRILLARLALAAGDAETAVVQYREILARHPDDEAVRTRLGTLLLHLSRPEEARDELARAAALSAAPPPLLLVKLGQARLALCDLEGAYAAFQSSRSHKEGELGALLIELIAAGGDPTQIHELTGPGSLWLRLLEMAAHRTPEPAATG